MGLKRKSNSMAEVDSEEENLNISDDEDGGIRIGDVYIPPAPKPVCSNDIGAPRLIISHIVNTNFKSFAGSITLGPFHKCFTSIIGPNGNGKSNVIDSILFVFGYRASKIRSKKISVLIHNSEQHQDLQSCSVAIHFTQILDKDDEDSFEEIPNTKLVVSRTAFKDNSSYYEVNGRRVQFKYIAKLLGEHGVDLHYNRFLILQGEVEQIAMMKPKAPNEHESGMLEYLEDIVGTSRYKEPILKLIQNVEHLTQLRSEKLVRVKLATKECNELEEPMQVAVQFLKIENTITSNKSLQYQKYIFDHEKLLKEREEKKRTILDIYNKLKEKMHEIERQKKEHEKVIQQGNTKLNNLKKRKETMTECFEKANKKDIALQEDIVQTNQNRKKIKEQLKSENVKLTELHKIPEKNSSEIVILEKKVVELNEKKRVLEEEKKELMATMADKIKPLLDKREQLETQLTKLKDTVGKEKCTYDLAESELQLYMKGEQEESDKLEKLHTAYEECVTSFKEKKKIVETLKAKIPETEKSLEKAQMELNGVQNEENIVISEMRLKRAQLEEKRSTMQSAKSRGRVLDALMKHKQEGNIQGLLGRLGDLGAIDLKYDIAISTACGPLDNIVVDTVTTAQNCIDFLKRNNIGRASFIALEKQEHLRTKATTPINTPENVHRLFDLIKITDERLRTAFYFALRDTLVADNLEQAMRIAYGSRRYRVVTLAGDLIEIAGTMSGGGKSVSRGRMGQRVALNTSLTRDSTGENIKNMEQKVQELEQRSHSLREQHDSLEQQIVILKTELRKMMSDLPKYTIELEALSQKEPVLKKQLKDQEKRAANAKPDPKQVANLQKNVDNQKLQLQKANDAAVVVQTKVDELTKDINEKTGDKVKVMDKQLSDIKNKIDKLRTEITRLTVAIKTSERNVKKTTEKIANMENDVLNAQNRLLEMQEERKTIEVDATKMIKTIEEITAEIEQHDQDFDGVRKEIKTLVDAGNKLKSDKVEIDQQLTIIDKNINECKGNLPHWRMKLSQLKLNEIPTEKDEKSTSLKIYTEEELNGMNFEEINYQLTVQEEKLQSCKPNLAVIQQYKTKQEELNKWINHLDEVNNKRTEMKKLHDELIKKRNDDFLIGFHIINSKLKEMYQMLTLGGDAELELVDSMDPFSEGVNFSVRPPKKSWKNISNLSGGEKTLSSLALVFALHYYKPSPLYFMDEIDAALDFKNVSIVGNYIKERTKNAQFIIISLRSNMFELADRLIGIYKTYNSTKTVTLNPKLYSIAPVQNTITTSSQPLNPVNQNLLDQNVD